ALLSISAIIFYQADSADFLIALIFGVVSNLYLHESIHYIVQSRLGYEPVFEWPNRVWVPDVALSVKEGVISLLSPQILTLIYVGMLPLSQIQVVDFMIVIALIFNLTGGFRDIAWAIRRLLWPEGHLVLVDSEGREFISFPK
ncbi:MAG: hypothetical protein ABEI86_00150, partial [Halobacteriaceae archaeon]